MGSWRPSFGNNKGMLRIFGPLGILSLATLFVSSCGIRVDSDCACGFYTDGAGKMMHWGDGAQIKFVIEESMPADMATSITAVEDTYNSAFENLVIKIDSSQGGLKKATATSPDGIKGDHSGDDVNGIYWVAGEWPWQSTDEDSDAMTIVRFGGGKIVEADIFFKASSFTPSNSSSSLMTQTSALTEITSRDILGPSLVRTLPIDAQWIYVIGVHEMGHALGRVHAHDKKSVMFPSVGLSFLTKPFSDYDLELFKQVYQLRSSGIQTSVAGHSL